VEQFDLPVPRPDAESVAPDLRQTGFRRGEFWPRHRWILPNGQVLDLDCGGMGYGPITAKIDRVKMLVFDKPSKAQPCVEAPIIDLHGHPLQIWTDSHNWGDLIGVDVFVDGVSLFNGALQSSLAKRRARTEAAAATYVHPFESRGWARQAPSSAISVGAAFGVAGIVRNVRGHSIEEVALWSAVFLAVMIPCEVALRRRAMRLPATGRGRKRRAAAVILASLAAFFAPLALIVLGPLAPR
jgi:hypothetical protein